jgi:formylglycine-generating enzyme required for sulfatase activity
MTTLFLSYSSADNAWATEIKSGLETEGYAVFIDTELHGGPKWEPALWQYLRRARGLVFLCTTQWLDSPWCTAEVLIARDRGLKVFGIITAEAEQSEKFNGTLSNLKDTQLIRLSRLPKEEAFRQVLQLLAIEGLREVFPPAPQPYPGLRAFDEGDADVYFGRDDDIANVMRVLERRRLRNARGFILVLGASGCGKSSLVRAGVLPRLKRANGNTCGGRWLIPNPVMGGGGLEDLVLAFDVAWQQTGNQSQITAIREQLKTARQTGGVGEDAVRSLRELATDLLAAHGLADGIVLLVLDQLEEVFRTPEGSDARSMLWLLLEASADLGSRLAVLATMRSHFLNHFQLFEGAAESYEKITLDPMRRSRFVEVIEGPAGRFGLRLEEGLAQRLVDDTAYNDLPLLAFTLKKLYGECGAHGLLEIKGYEKLFPEVEVREDSRSVTYHRGVSAAIKHQADKILRDTGYFGLPDDDPRMRDLRSAFYRLAQVGEEGRLAQVGEEGQFTRRVARWSQMPESCKPVLRQFIRQRLLVSGAVKVRVEEGGEQEKTEPSLSVAHEALFRIWDTLNGWLRADRKALALRAQIEEAAAECDAEQRSGVRGTLLWSEERVLDTVRVIEDSGVSLEDVADRKTVNAFLGPTEREKLEKLPALNEAEDATPGSDRYGAAWRLPLSHEARASTGVRLAILGDRRPGVGLRDDDGLPDLDWCPVEGGDVTIEIRKDPNYAHSEVIDRLPRSVAPFRMARYPVTIAQFQAFLNGCHRDGEWRLPAGFPVSLPADYWPPEPRARHDNHPVDSVNWYDAMMFCHWLSTRLNFLVRLPTEYEWQLAATGGDAAFTYPWGPNWDPAQEPWRANTLESELGRSTAVGMYPSGASQAGILDMAGTLWEWCSNAADDPDNTTFPTAQEDRRVLRGGSWNYYRVHARSADRDELNPYLRSNNVGFRVVCSSPSSGR